MQFAHAGIKLSFYTDCSLTTRRLHMGKATSQQRQAKDNQMAANYMQIREVVQGGWWFVGPSRIGAGRMRG